MSLNSQGFLLFSCLTLKERKSQEVFKLTKSMKQFLNRNCKLPKRDEVYFLRDAVSRTLTKYFLQRVRRPSFTATGLLVFCEATMALTLIEEQGKWSDCSMLQEKDQ